MSQLIAWTGGRAVDVPLDCYPDGSPLVVFDRATAPIDRLLLRQRDLGGLMAAMFFVDALAARGQAVPHLILPLPLGSRQDRLNDSGDFLFTARSVASEINARRFPSVTVLDPHSDVTPALIERCRVLPASRCLKAHGRGYSAVVAPDGGSEKRAGGAAKLLKLPLLHAWKTRDVATGAISGFGLEVPAGVGGRVLVVDDICDGGGTFIGLADQLDRAGLTADLFVTHGVFSKGTAPLLARFRKVFCTDSVLGDKPGVEAIPICDYLLKGIDIS